MASWNLHFHRLLRKALTWQVSYTLLIYFLNGDEAIRFIGFINAFMLFFIFNLLPGF